MSLVIVDTIILADGRDFRVERKQAIVMDGLRIHGHQRTGRLPWQVLLEGYALARCSGKWAMVMVTALKSGCTTRLAEDRQHERSVEGTMTTVNPFAENASHPRASGALLA